MSPKIMPLVHPKMLAALKAVGFFPHLCRIEHDASATVDTHNQPIPDWQPLLGHEAIPAARTAIGGQEVKGNFGDVDVTTHTIALQGYFPAIRPEMRAVVAGETHDILLVSHDDLLAVTYLGTKILRV